MTNFKLLVFLILLTEVVSEKAIEESEEDEPIGQCGRYDVCNIVYKPVYGKNEVEKLCLCPNNTFCPATHGNDHRSLPVNVRTQMKFCYAIEELLSELPACEEGREALKVGKLFYINQVLNKTTTLLCGCNKNPVYWKYNATDAETVPHYSKLLQTYDYYECADLKRCNTNDFCGLARTDFGFLFQRCTCNYTDKCRYYVEESEIVEDVQELFYDELFYKAHCLRDESFTDW